MLHEVSNINFSQIPTNEDGLIVEDIKNICTDLNVVSIGYILALVIG